LDIIIINAAIGGLDALLASSPSVLESYLATNVIGPHHIVSAFLPALRRGRDKKIIFISSSAGSFKIAGSPTRMVRSGVYSVSKAAVNMLAVQYADELKEEGFVVVPMHPGWVATDMGSLAGEGGMQPSVSAKSIVDVVEGLKKDDNAKFFRFDGTLMPW
ncbi:NAD(P)-binding protein, partial [Armillaria solidipes]